MGKFENFISSIRRQNTAKPVNKFKFVEEKRDWLKRLHEALQALDASDPSIPGIQKMKFMKATPAAWGEERILKAYSILQEIFKPVKAALKAGTSIKELL